jgi:type I restriction enzyme S subunit
MSWVRYKLGDVCFIEKGKIGIQKAVPGAFPLVVTAEERLSHNEAHFEGNAVVIPLVSSTGHGHKSLKRIHFQSGKFAVGNILCVVMPKAETFLRADFLYRFLDLNREKELVSRMKGMANVTLPMKEIANIEIPIPPIEDQVSFVQKYNLLEEHSKELNTEIKGQIELVKQLRQAFLREAMQGNLIPQDPNDEPASVLLEKIKAVKEQLIKEKKIKKDKPLPPISENEIPFEIPENWEWCRLGEMVFDQLYGTSSKADLTGDIPVLRMGNITTDGKVLYSNLKYVSKKIKDLPNLYLKNGDLVFNRTNSFELVGKCGVFYNEEPFTLASYLIRIRLSEYSIPEFFSNYINSSLCRETQIEPKIIQQNGQANFNGTKLSNIISPLPPLSEQQQIVTKLNDLMKMCNDLEASIKESQQQNEVLLQQVLREALEVK